MSEIDGVSVRKQKRVFGVRRARHMHARNPQFNQLQSFMKHTFRRSEFARKKRRFGLVHEPNVAIPRAQKGGFCISSHFRPALEIIHLIMELKNNK